MKKELQDCKRKRMMLPRNAKPKRKKKRAEEGRAAYLETVKCARAEFYKRKRLREAEEQSSIRHRQNRRCNAARIASRSAEEQEEAAERNREKQRRHRENVAEREADERREEQQGGFHDCWNLTEDQILPFLKQKGKNPEELDRYFADIHRNPSKAVLLYYLNSGHGRFQQHKVSSYGLNLTL